MQHDVRLRALVADTASQRCAPHAAASVRSALRGQSTPSLHSAARCAAPSSSCRHGFTALRAARGCLGALSSSRTIYAFPTQCSTMCSSEL
ncbi:hypothetical protein NDU88_000316 [Pleurodeles waltl]|uniref:Uncharacterized protein n=1 Tax=Pleurodeles waltl TaxID=8319 RepID=A0AAV7L9U2_PLEWA|nr:hypothetical protein NDU88_000316 [Pleurodeles waltl]